MSHRILAKFDEFPYANLHMLLPILKKNYLLYATFLFSARSYGWVRHIYRGYQWLKDFLRLWLPYFQSEMENEWVSLFHILTLSESCSCPWRALCVYSIISKKRVIWIWILELWDKSKTGEAWYNFLTASLLISDSNHQGWPLWPCMGIPLYRGMPSCMMNLSSYHFLDLTYCAFQL